MAAWSSTFLVPLALCAACSSSSTGASPPEADGGAEASNVISPLSDSGGVGQINASCGQLAALSGGAPSSCPAGQTCCTTLTIATFSASSICVAIGQCSGGISNECQSAAECTTGSVCCAGPPASDAGAEAGGGSGSPGGFSFAALSTACQPACDSGQRQQCATDGECPAGTVCRASNVGGTAAFGGAGGFTGGAGAGDAGTLASLKTCAPPLPDAGVGDAQAE
jgi:hypothetical protein